MNTQVSFLDGTYSLIHIPLDLYTSLLQPVLAVLLPQSQTIKHPNHHHDRPGAPPASATAASSSQNPQPTTLKGLTQDHQHRFLNISVTPLECSVVCHTSWVQHVFEPFVRRHLTPHDAASVTVSRDSYSILSVVGAGLDAAGRVMELSSPLAIAGVPIFFISTYYSDFILAPAKERKKVTKALLSKGFELSENQSSFVSPSSSQHKKGAPRAQNVVPTTTTSSTPESSPPPPRPSAAELQTHTFNLLKERNVMPFIEEGLELVQCAGRETSQLHTGYTTQRPSLSRRATGSDLGPGSWLENVDTKLYAGIVSALVTQPRFLSLTLVEEDPPSLLLDRKLLPLFGDSVVGDTEGRHIPIMLDLGSLPFEVTGIVCGVAGQLIQDLQIGDSLELSYLSTARAGAVILPEEQSARAFAVLEPLLHKDS